MKKMQDEKIPGLQIAVVKNNKIIKTENYGIANLQDNIAVTDKTVFTINSITKSFIGVAIMQLVEKGKLALSDKASSYVTDLPDTWQNITIKQLLTHTSGLPEIELGTSLIAPEGAEASWSLVKTLPLAAKANTQFQYTSTNYVLLGKIITQVSGNSFTDFITENQLIKVGMRRTEAAGFAHFQGVIPHQARGYTYYFGNELTTIQYELPPFLRAAAGMSSNAKEIAQWVIALQKGELLSEPSSLKVLWSPAVLESGKTAGFDRLLNGYALGWQVIDRAEHPAIAAVGGDRSALVIYPQDNLSIVVITNLMGANPQSFIDEIAEFYIADMEAINGIAVTESTLKNYVGHYTFSNFSIDVMLKDGRLSFLASGEGQEPFILYAKSDTHFFAKVVDLQVSFKHNDNGSAPSLIIHQGDENYLGTRAR
ncbi:serine hydrolase [Arsukibacterium sp.]|uniref:serine hydrolase n=1 Tax=Arsukibacterium sp. TaxID=1977258 RepID=UPI00299E8DAA|nr:serine hydrolase [Arsukibacterium sp.]MDX1538908.1 serine hydrolase [Arsukibacterium sp.]